MEKVIRNETLFVTFALSLEKLRTVISSIAGNSGGKHFQTALSADLVKMLN